MGTLKSVVKKNSQFLFRRKADQEAATWLNMVEAPQCAQPQGQNPDLATPKDALLVKLFFCATQIQIHYHWRHCTDWYEI